MDHAGWRFILKISKAFFASHAHPMYVAGLERTGISSERIPLIEEMDAKLTLFGWRAVPVCGFIPPSVFMEFLSLGILPIACDMRQAGHLAYTPAPDIVHEAAGHAPIIADPEYAAYLKRYGEISRKAIHSARDWDLYLAIRGLSDVKEDPRSTAAEIQSAQDKLDAAIAAVDHVSEATELARMSWWTIEYGLIGTLDSSRIYGAGLLSSVGESYQCLGPDVRKIPLTLDCIRQGYDITKPQPQLFVAPDFATLTRVLDELAETMAFRRGGVEGLRRARMAAAVTTTVFDNGLQISGIVEDFDEGEGSAPAWIRYRGPIQLARGDRELQGHGAGLRVMSVTARPGERLHFGQSDSPFLCGAKVLSVFGGAADRGRYLEAIGGFDQPPGRPKTNLTDENRALNALYAEVRALRDRPTDVRERIQEIHAALSRGFPEEWLLRYELLELGGPRSLRTELEGIAHLRPALASMIQRGLALLPTA